VSFQVFGLTGGIGSGKSSVAALLRERGVPVVDADELAREVVVPGSDGLRQVVLAFGDEVLDESGQLDRKRLGALVFADVDARKRLNSLLHPLVRQLAQQRFSELAASGVTLAAYDVPLLFEVGLEQSLRPVVVVSADDAARLERVMARDGLGADQVRARMGAQLPLAAKRARADHVIDNDGPKAALGAQVDALLRALRAPSAPG
jgi:dephospho-CoA kinase